MPIFIILLVSVKCRLNIGGCLSHYFSLFGVNYGRFLAKRESAAVFALPLVGRFSTKMLKTYRMKQKDSGTLFVPQFRTPELIAVVFYLILILLKLVLDFFSFRSQIICYHCDCYKIFMCLYLLKQQIKLTFSIENTSCKAGDFP